MRRDRRRRSLVLVYAVLVALTLAAIAAKAQAPPHRHRMGGVSSIALPYVAPWQTGFKRYSTQIVQAATVFTNQHRITVPQGQWWRIVYWEEDWNSDATVGDRFLSLTWTINNKAVLNIGAPVVQKASQEYVYVFTPGGAAFSALPAGRTGFAQSPIPDVLWQPGTIIDSIFAGILGLDAEFGSVNVAVEVYTVEKDGAIVPVTPTPLIP